MSFLCGFFFSSSCRKNSSSVPFHASTTHVRQIRQKKREIFANHSLKTQEEKAKEEQKFQRISTDLS